MARLRMAAFNCMEFLVLIGAPADTIVENVYVLNVKAGSGIALVINKYNGNRCYRRVWNGITIPFVNDIFPGVITGNCVENKGSKAYRNLFKGTYSNYLNTNGGKNSCVLDWKQDEIVISWNGRVVAHEKDSDTLKWFNDSEGMEIHLNNYVANDFSEYNYHKLPNDCSRCLRITDLKYTKNQIQ